MNEVPGLALHRELASLFVGLYGIRYYNLRALQREPRVILFTGALGVNVPTG